MARRNKNRNSRQQVELESEQEVTGWKTWFPFCLFPTVKNQRGAFQYYLFLVAIIIGLAHFYHNYITMTNKEGQYAVNFLYYHFGILVSIYGVFKRNYEYITTGQNCLFITVFCSTQYDRNKSQLFDYISYLAAQFSAHFMGIVYIERAVHRDALEDPFYAIGY